MSDNVNNPKHYEGATSIECIEAMIVALVSRLHDLRALQRPDRSVCTLKTKEDTHGNLRDYAQH